jgi:dienelactone hydrolase
MFQLRSIALASAALALFLVPAHATRANEPQITRGEVRFEPVANESTVVPAPFRLEVRTFPFEQKPQPGWGPEVDVSLVTFPSPVKTPYEANNTVHCEYFRPAKPGKYPACVVLHILGGDFPLARVFANTLAKNGVCALFVKMPYYGERRPEGVNVRMVSTNPEETVAGMTQAVKDIRCAAAWLASREEVDASQLGVFGISLGGITASLAATAEPRFTKVCPVLAGGDLNTIITQTTERHLVAAKEGWTKQGHTLAELMDLMKTVDPCTYATAIAGRKVLMLNASNDEVIPRSCTDRLWVAFGKPEIYWYDCGHYTAVFHITDALTRVCAFFSGAAVPVEKAAAN